MQAARIMPDLQCSLVCEQVRQEANGNFIIIGVVNYLRVPGVPITAMNLCVFNRWTAGVGQFNQLIRLLAPDQVTVLAKNEMKFELQDPSASWTCVAGLGQIEFKEAGVCYYVEVLVDDITKIKYPVPVLLAPQQNQPQA